MYYRDLIVWRKSVDLTREVYQLVPSLPREETWGMRSQLTRAAVSVPANIAEGWTRESDKEKAQFLSIAHESLAETDTLLVICEENGWFSPQDTSHVRSLMIEIGKMVSTMRRNLRERIKT